MRAFFFAVASLVAALASFTSYAQSAAPEGITKTLAGLGVQPSSVSESLIPGLYEVTFGTRVFYLTGDGQHMMRGELINVADGKNLTQEKVSGLRQGLLASLDESQMIVFEPKKAKHTVTVFTDVDCGYCAKLHREMPMYHDAGIRVRYLAFPRAGVDSNSGRKIQSVWCSVDQHEAMTRAKAGREVKAPKCENPVANHFSLGRDFGVRGTPTIILDSGEIIPGYAPAKQLLEVLESGKSG